MKIIIPMLGRGSKFKQAGVKEPKHLLMVRGKPLFAWSLEALKYLKLEKDACFLIKEEEAKEWSLDKEIKKIVGKKANIKIYNFIPEGAAKTVLLLRDIIETDEELIIYNADQFFVSKQLKKYLKKIPKDIDGLIPTFHATHPKWSYVQTDNHGKVLLTAEKEPISTQATVGLYYFKHGKDFVEAADQMIKKQLMVGNEYYVCPVYNELVEKDKKIIAFPVDQMWGLGTPEDVYRFEKYYKED